MYHLKYKYPQWFLKTVVYMAIPVVLLLIVVDKIQNWVSQRDTK